MKVTPTPQMSRPLEVPPGPPAAKAPSEDGRFTIDDIICPFQRAAFNEGVLKADADGNVTNLKEVLQKYAGASWLMAGIAVHAAKKLTAGSDWAAFQANSYNLQDLEGSSLDHLADSQILRGGFHADRLEKALSFSSDGKRLTLADLRAFQQENLAEEPGRNSETFGAAEFALLVKVFGRIDGAGTKFIRNQDLVTLYRDAKWPQDWEPPKPGSLNLLSTVGAVSEYLSDKNEPTREQGLSSQTTKGSSGSCPFLSGRPFDVEEAAKQHRDKLA